MAGTRAQRSQWCTITQFQVNFVACAIVAFVVFLLAGCSPQAALLESDEQAIAQLAEIAPKDSEIDGNTTQVECWKPSESMIDDVTFRVICRVHYDQSDSDRYRDMICIGALLQDPVTDHCYRWAYYTDTPQFEDQPGYIAS